MSFDWDPAKEAENVRKHGVSFENAVKIFDGLVVSEIDHRDDYGEIREISLGLLDGIVVLMVVHTDRDGVTRLISARKATSTERSRYEEAVRQSING